jgi:hypothetical protein
MRRAGKGGGGGMVMERNRSVKLGRDGIVFMGN